MKLLKPLGLKIAVLAAAMLVAIGGWEVYRGTVLTVSSQQFEGPPKGDFEALKCYQIKALEEVPDFKGAEVNLFGGLDPKAVETVRIKDADLLCVTVTVAPTK